MKLPLENHLPARFRIVLGFKPPRRTIPVVSRAFTVVELLLVVSIVILVAGFAVPAVTTVLKGTQLAQAGQMLNDQLNLARQTALVRNHSIEVRFYQFSDSDTAASGNAGTYCAFQTFDIDGSNNAVALNKIQRLPSSIIIDSGTALSPVINTPSAYSKPTPAHSASNVQTLALPRVGTNYNSVAIRFLPDGSLNLSRISTNPWFVTLHNVNEGDSLAAPKANFVTLQIDANNGHIKTFRP